MPDVHAVYIGSNDYWGYDADTFNDRRQFFGRSWVVKASDVTEEKISEDNLNRCALYYEIGKTDSHNFTPTSIEYNADADFVLVTGELGTIGEPGRTVTHRRAYGLGNKAMRYRAMTDDPDSRGAGMFETDYIVVSDDSDVDNIKQFIDDLDGEEEEVVEASAEEFSAENLNRINPVAIEGAEDVYGAESLNSNNGQVFHMEDEANQDFMEDWQAEGRVVGQNYEGYEVGQEAAAEDEANQDFMEDWSAESHPNDIFHVVLHGEEGALEVHTTAGSTFLADIETGAIMHDSAGFAAEDSEPLNAEDISFLLTHASEGNGIYEFVDDQTGEDPLEFDPSLADHTHEAHEEIGPIDSSPMHGVPEDYGQGMEVEIEAENVVEAVQETLDQIPLVNRFELGGWAASALVVGIAGLTGWWIARD